MALDARYNEQGFAIVPKVVRSDGLDDAVEHMDAVIAGDYETGVAPHWRRWNPGDDELRLRKIDQPQLSDRAIQRLIADPAVGRAAAELTGAQTIQVWAVQLLYKPPAGGSSGNVGWHQDQQYWLRWWTPDSEVFTCWLALSDVTEAAGAMRFVPGSHRWGLLGTGDFYRQETDLQRDEIGVPDGETWTEIPAILDRGSASFHHRLTFHASGPNTSPSPRRSFAIHLRTEHSELADLTPLPAEEAAYMSYLDDPDVCPVIHRGQAMAEV
jgi:ectoine hydroxylase-related dioxygenase (phytanoyl-CoA dioxygenase family)